MTTTAIHERVVDLYEYADGAFFVKGHVSPDLAWYQIKDFLDETMGKAGWHDLTIGSVRPHRGRWEELPDGDERWVEDPAGEPWSMVFTEWQMA